MYTYIRHTHIYIYIYTGMGQGEGPLLPRVLRRPGQERRGGVQGLYITSVDVYEYAMCYYVMFNIVQCSIM